MSGFSGRGYSLVSILFHWLGAAAFIFLFFTGENGEDAAGSGTLMDHAYMGVILGLPLLVRVIWRIRGFTELPPQHRALEVLAKLVKIGFLLSIVGVVISGFVMMWAEGQIMVVGGMRLPALIEPNDGLAEAAEGLHEFFAHVWIPLLILHVVGALKHAIMDRDGVLGSMFKPRSGGH